MLKLKVRKICILLTLLILVSMLGTGCKVEVQNEGEGIIKGGSGEVQNESKEEPPVKLTMFMTDAGTVVPKDVDPGNNPYISIVEKMANVDLEIIKPERADYQTKFNLMMASGDLNDIVHATFPEEVKKYGESGAFVALDDYMNKSSALSGFVVPEAVELQKSSDGKLYGLFAQDSKNYSTAIARVDLIEKLNDGKTPTTPDEWYEFMKKVKQNNPEAVPYTARGQLRMMETFFRAYGVNISGGIVGWQIHDGKVISALEAPKMKEAILWHKRLYDEGLLEQEFVVNASADWINRIMYRDMVIWGSTAASFQVIMRDWLKVEEKDKMVAFVPHPIAPGVDPKDVYYPKNILTTHSLSIFSGCKNIPAAIKVLEAFISPEIKLAASWGLEGVDYTVQNGERVLNLENSVKSSWKIIYGFMWQYWYDYSPNNTEIIEQLDDDAKSKYLQYWERGEELKNKEADIAGVHLWSFMPSDSKLQDIVNEANELAKALVVKAIIGEITMEQYENQVGDFLNKYSQIKDQYQKWYDSYSQQ